MALAASGRAALAKAGPFAYKTSHHGAWRSMVAHLLWEQGVAGSNPVAPTIRKQEVIPRCGVTSFCLEPMPPPVPSVSIANGERHESAGSGTSHIFTMFG